MELQLARLPQLYMIDCAASGVHTAPLAKQADQNVDATTVVHTVMSEGAPIRMCAAHDAVSPQEWNADRRYRQCGTTQRGHGNCEQRLLGHGEPALRAS